MSTPHARGSTPKHRLRIFYDPVYPACAGIHRCRPPPLSSITSLPRMRGDPPMLFYIIGEEVLSTPHARGSTAQRAAAPAN